MCFFQSLEMSMICKLLLALLPHPPNRKEEMVTREFAMRKLRGALAKQICLFLYKAIRRDEHARDSPIGLRGKEGRGAGWEEVHPAGRKLNYLTTSYENGEPFNNSAAGQVFRRH